MNSTNNGLGKVKFPLIIVALLLIVLTSAVLFGVRTFSLRYEGTKEETLSETKKEKKFQKKKKKKVEKDGTLTEISSLGDTAPASNLLGNCYVITDGTKIFFKNQYDGSEIYSYSGSGSVGSLNRISSHTAGQMYYYKDYIYYTDWIDDKNVPGSVAIYRAKADGSAEEMLMPFDTDSFYLILEALADGKLYFTFNKEAADGKSIYQMDLETLNVQLLYTIPVDMSTEFSLVNATKNGLYFKDKEGLKKLNLENKEIELVIKGFDAMYYTIYKGYVYYTQSKKGKYDKNIVRRVFLDGSDDELIYTAKESWIYDITVCVLNDKLFILTDSEPDTSDPQSNIYACELDGSKFGIISDKANLFGMTDNAIYYGFSDESKITETNTVCKRFEATRSAPTYKRDVSGEGKISDEYLFLDPEALNKAWVTCKNYTNFYNPQSQGLYKIDYLYYDENGELYKNSWKNIDGKDYYFGEDGRMYSQEFTPDGYFVGVDGTVSNFIAPFKFVYSEYPNAGMHISTDKYNEDNTEGFYKGDKTSTVIDRGQVYELTNTNIFATTSFSEEEAAQMEAGYSMYIKGNSLFCTVTGKEEYNEDFQGECIGLKQSKFPDIEFKLVKNAESGRYVLKVKRGIDSKVIPLSFMIYSGSVYVMKDAKLDIYKADALSEPPVETTFADYNTSFREVIAESGENPDEFYFKGNIVYFDGNNTYSITKLNMYN